MTRSLTSWLLPSVGATLLALHLARDLFGFGGATLEPLVAAWFQPAVYLLCGVATLARAGRSRAGRPWLLVGVGLVLYSAGSVYFNLSPDAGFPSLADALWLSLYPLTAGALGVLVRRRFSDLSRGVWLDGLIAGTAVAALVAAIVFGSVFDVALADGAASLARLGYPVGDLIGVGVVGVIWSVLGRRFELSWALLGLGFALLAVGDSTYVVQAASGGWAPGAPSVDFPYAAATALLAAAAWTARDDAPGVVRRGSRRFVLPVAAALTALGLTTYALLASLNPLATTLSLLTLLAVVLRLGSALGRLSRQRIDLAVQAATDPLTGLANHRALHERLGKELERARAAEIALSVVALDLDHFKAINDTYGYTEGDIALQAVAAELLAEAHDEDLVGRVGGEEFMIVLPGATAEEAYATAERCRGALARLSVHGVALSCSAGVASFPADDAVGTRLTELADGALYWAKRSGRAQTRRYDPREVVLLSGAEQREQVRALLAREDVLTPVFQPIVELATGRIAGYEALTRFEATEPVRAPDVWFAQARRCGLGPALEARAIEVSLAVPGRPASTFISLNVSPGALVSPEVAAVLPDGLHDVVIELTEDEVFSADTALDSTLQELRARGARIAVDDAGAGYAGLQQLVRVKPEIVKLDRSLITGVDRDASKIALLEALARFADTTGASVCGEGIETVSELRALARLDTTYAQGYALGRPGPAWPGVATSVAEHTTAEVTKGMRLAAGTPDSGGAPTLGEVTEALARGRTRDDLNAAVGLIGRLLHADEVVVSRVLADERCVVTLSEHDWATSGERFRFDDFPTTEHVVTAQVLGQLIEGDTAADLAELRLLAESGFGALLMAPIIFRGETVGLLESFRRAPRPWAASEIDHARLVAHGLGPALGTDLSAIPAWTPEMVSRPGTGATSAPRR